MFRVTNTQHLCKLNSLKQLNLQQRVSCFSSSTRVHANAISSHDTTIDGMKVFWEKAGTGAHNVLLLPGALGSTRTDFSPQLEELNGQAFTLHCWDPPGYGKSRPPNRTWPEKFFNRDAACAASLIKSLGLNKVSLVGWSDGGITALVMAVLYPDMVDRMVLFGCNAYMTPYDVQLLENIRDLSKWSERMKKPMEDLYGSEYFESQWNQWIDAYSLYLNKFDGDIVKDRVKEIQCPTLIIHGQKDALVPQEHPDYLHSQIKDSRLINWPDGKHNLHLRYADEFNKLVTDFLLADDKVASKL